MELDLREGKVRILIALDSFKGSATSSEAGRALARGILSIKPDWQVEVLPIADGGEGTLEALSEALGGERVFCCVKDPLGRPTEAWFLWLREKRTAVVELAKASGLPLLKPEERNPLKTTTYGTGQLIRKACELGAKRVIITVGGSATNDAGLGICSALGVRFLDSQDRELPPVGASLSLVAKIDDSQMPAELRSVHFEVAADVRNPLYGPEGAAYVYAPQKGATFEEVKRLDEGLRRFADCLQKKTSLRVAEIQGAGAAGGVPASLVALFGAEIVEGFETVASLIGLDKKISATDLVVTGEGKLDSQTLKGKTAMGVAKHARNKNVAVFAVGGQIEREAEDLTQWGVVGFFPIVWRPLSLREAMEKALGLLEDTGRRMAYLISWALGK